MQLPRETSASALLFRLLQRAQAEFSELAAVPLPGSAAAFKKGFAWTLPAFEACRAASARRSEIARFIAAEAGAALVHRDEEGRDENLVEYLQRPAAPLPLTTLVGTAAASFAPTLHMDGAARTPADLPDLLRAMERDHEVTPPAAAALATMTRELTGGRDLRGEKFVILGAGAELAPTPLLLAAGADVLWIDITPPALTPDTFAGTLSFCPDGADLLRQTAPIIATIEAFAGGKKVHVGMFAYAAGRGREWRLEAAMNAITRAMTREVVASVGVYVSPTSPMVTHPADLAAAEARGTKLPTWQRAARGLRILRPGHARSGEIAVCRSIVPLQGASYQAAQYVAKTLAAEAFAFAPDASRRVPRVSANVAGITNTSSMGEPAFQAAFLAAHRFSVRIFDPTATRVLSGMLLLHDLVHADQPTDAAPAHALFERQIHGGVFASPHALAGQVNLAGVIGLARRPSLAMAMVRR